MWLLAGAGLFRASDRAFERSFYAPEIVVAVSVGSVYADADSFYARIRKFFCDIFRDQGSVRGHYHAEILFVANESKKVSGNEILLGSREIIESVIGKFKNMEHDQAKSDFTSTLLNFASIVGKTTKETIFNAMESIPTNIISEWATDNLGKRYYPRKRRC